MEPDPAARRGVELTTTLSALLGAGLLLGAAALDALEPERSRYRTVSILALTIGACVLFLLLMREIVRRRRTLHALERSTQAVDRIRRLPEGASEELPFDDLLEELARQARETVGASWVALVLPDEDTSELEVVAATPTAPRQVGDAIDAAELPGDAPTGPISVPLRFELGAGGALEIAPPPGRPFDPEERSVTRVVAERVASAIDRARLTTAARRSRLGAVRARSHLRLVAAVSIVLARALEDANVAIGEMAEVLLRDFADLCMVHLARSDGTLDRVAARIRDLATDGVTEPAPDSDGIATAASLGRVMASGASELAFTVGDGDLQGRDDDFARSLRGLGMTSWVIAPIRVHGLSIGTITLGTGPKRRGFRPADRAVTDEIANRVGITVERSLLYTETRHAATQAERRAAQLGRLVESAIALNPSLPPQDLLDALARQAVQVTDAAHVTAWLQSDEPLEADHGNRPARPVRARSPLVDAGGRDIGYVSVERAGTEPFTADDEAAVTLLARLASTALQNARLYDEVRVREQRLQTLVAASPLAILELDLHGEVRAANPAARALFATSASPEVATLPEDLRPTLTTLTARALAGEIAEADVSTVVEGEAIDLWVSTAALRGNDASPTGVLAVVSETTERNRLEEQLVAAQRYEAIAQLAGGVAHDFNNLLTIIVGYSDLLLQEAAPGSVEYDDISAIQQAGQHAGVITNQLLTLSRNLVAPPIVVPIGTTVGGLAPMLRRLAGDHVDVRVETAADVPIRIEAGQLEQIVFNLVLNSRDAMPAGGLVVVRTERGDGDEVRLSVRDTGQGMDADARARCLEPFFTTKGRRGIGLGLSTVSTIVQRAGGRLEIDSEAGQGTTMTVVFPSATPVEAVATPAPARRAARILLVDDDEQVRRYARKGLVDAGFDVTAVDDAEAAVAAADAHGPYDLLVSDVVLPGMSGADLLRVFASRWPTTGCLLMTGFAGNETDAADLGDAVVLTKPFALDDLTRAVDETLERARR